MSLNNFIPALWTAKLLQNLNDEHVYADLFNRDYEGEIRAAGDTVRINTVGRINVSSYTKNSTTLTRQNPDAAGQALLIDQSSYFDFEIDDLDKAQAKTSVMSDFMQEAAWSLADTVDADLASELWSGMAGNGTANTGNRLVDATSVGAGATDDDAFQILIDLSVKLDEDNVPKGGRWAVVPPWYMGVLSVDPRASSFGTGENRKVFANGRIEGQIAGFDMRVSNNVTLNGSAYRISAGYRGAATFAKQLNDVEGYRPHDAFSDAMKGLLLYGRKIVRPSALAGVEATAA